MCDGHIPIGPRRSECPISFALDLFGDRWTLLVVRDLAFKGKDSFSEFLTSGEGIARNILSDRLASLKAQGFVAEHPHPDDGRRSVYRPTERGLGLVPVLVERIVWSAREDPRTGAPEAWVQEVLRDREGLIRRLQGRAVVWPRRVDAHA